MNQQNPGNGQGQQVQPNNPGGSGHPAWQEYLTDVPEALRPVVQAAFQKWDQNVQSRIQEVHNQYAPLKNFQPLVDNNIDLTRVAQALQFAQELEQDPKAMLEKMNQQLNLGYVPAAQVHQQQQQPIEDPFGDPFGGQQQLEANHPLMQQLQAMQQTMQTMQQQWDSKTQQEQQEAEIERFYDYLDTLVENTPLKDNEEAKTLIAGFMSGGFDGQAALEKVQSIYVNNLGQQTVQNLQQQPNNGQQPSSDNPLMAAVQATLQPVQQTDVGYDGNGQAPVVMGGAGNAGSGVPTTPIDFGAMKTDDVSALVAQALAQADQNSNAT